MNAQIVREDRVFYVIAATHNNDVGDLPRGTMTRATVEMTRDRMNYRFRCFIVVKRSCCCQWDIPLLVRGSASCIGSVGNLWGDSFREHCIDASSKNKLGSWPIWRTRWHCSPVTSYPLVDTLSWVVPFLYHQAAEGWDWVASSKQNANLRREIVDEMDYHKRWMVYCFPTSECYGMCEAVSLIS